MTRGKLEKGEAIIHFPTYLKEKQITWIKQNNKFKVHKFIQDKIEEYITNKEAYKQWKKEG